MFKEKLQPFIDRYNELSELLSSPDISSDIKRMTDLSKEQSDLGPLVEKAKQYIETADAIKENKELLGDPELGDLETLQKKSCMSWSRCFLFWKKRSKYS